LSIKNPGLASSRRITIEKLDPIKPAQKPNRKYRDPMSLWLVLSNQEVLGETP
jgi:hypothetical protein